MQEPGEFVHKNVVIAPYKEVGKCDGGSLWDSLLLASSFLSDLGNKAIGKAGKGEECQKLEGSANRWPRAWESDRSSKMQNDGAAWRAPSRPVVVEGEPAPLWWLRDATLRSWGSHVFTTRRAFCSC